MKKKLIMTAALALAMGVLAAPADAAKTGDDRLTITGDVRLLYVKYDYKERYQGGSGADYKYKYRTIRERVNLNYRLDEGHTFASVGFYDNRIPDDHRLDKGFFLNRALVTGQYAKFGYTVGRQPYMGFDDYVLYAENVDGAKLRFGPRNAYGQVFVGGVKLGKEYYHGFILKGVKEWKHWSLKSAYFDFQNPNRHNKNNQYQIWNNNVTYKFNDKLNLQYDRINAWGESYGTRRRHESGYLVTLNWQNYDLSKPNTFWFSLGYTHQPQGGFMRHSVMANPDSYDWNVGGYADRNALGFKGIGVYYSHVIAKNTSLSVEYYNWKNIKGYPGLDSFKEKTISTYLQYEF